ncbi:MAG: ComF family protein [Caenibius sp.]
MLRQPSAITRYISAVAEALSPVVDYALPPRCALCGDRVATNTGLCANCWPQLAIPGDPSCKLCQRPFRDGGLQQEAICPQCQTKAPQHDGIIAATLYNDASRQLVLSLKYGKRIGHAQAMARMIAARIHGLEGEWLLVPVPLHPRRLWRRSFNQAALMVQEISKHTGLPSVVDGLRRTRNSAPLGGMGRKARQSELQGAISANPAKASRLSGKNIILVDDVVTSGATSAACISALKRGGVGKVKIACFARVLDEQSASPEEWCDNG